MTTKEANTYQEAAAHAESAYWVEPVEWGPKTPNEGTMQAFDRRYQITDRSQDGKVHYSRR
jgi:hypothetical protein